MANALLQKQGYDLYFPSERLGLMLLRDGNGRAVSAEDGPSELGDDLVERVDVAVSWDDLSGGMGLSQVSGEGRRGPSRPTMYAWGKRLCTRWAGYVMPAGATTEVVLNPGVTIGEIKASFVQDGHLYFVAGRYVLRLANATDPGPITSTERDLGASMLGTDAILFDGAAYVAGSGGNIHKKTAGGGWSQSGTVAGTRFGTVWWNTPDGTGAYRLILQDALTTFRHIAAGLDPLTLTNYSSAIKVANASYQINSIVAANQHAWFCTAGGIADVDGRGYSPILNPYFAQQLDNTLNGATSFYHDGYIYVSHSQGLDRYDVSSEVRRDSPRFVMPGAGLSNETPVYGQCTALTSEGGWLVAAFWSGTDSYLMYGKDEREALLDAPGEFVWHGPEAVLDGERITHLRVMPTSPAANPCIWLASVTSGGAIKLRYLSIPKASSPLQELLNHLSGAGLYTGTHRWATDWELTYPDHDWGDQNDLKVGTRYDLRADRLNSTTYARLFARVEGGSYIQQGTGADPKFSRSPRSELIAVEAGLDAQLQGFNVGFRLVFTNTATAPPILREFRARAQIVTELRDTRAYSIDLGKTMQRNNAREVQSPRELLRKLRALQRRGPVDLYDDEDMLFKVRVNPRVRRREVSLKQAGSSTYQPTKVVDFTVSEIPTSPSQLALGAGSTPDVVPSNVLIWNSGDQWNGGKLWG